MASRIFLVPLCSFPCTWACPLNMADGQAPPPGLGQSEARREPAASSGGASAPKTGRCRACVEREWRGRPPTGCVSGPRLVSSLWPYLLRHTGPGRPISSPPTRVGVHQSFPPASGQCIYLPSGCLCLDARPPASPSKPPVSSCREVGRQLLPAPLGGGHVRWTWGAEPDEAAGLGFTFGRMDCIFRVTDGVRI